MTTIRLRNGTAAAASSNNPVLAAGEAGVETDTNRVKVGDGTTAWNDLPYSDNASVPAPASPQKGDTLYYDGVGWVKAPTLTLYGTGDPNGAVDAPEGSVFRNTESGGYNGARVWVKTSPAGTLTGWVVTNGDTGADNVAHLLEPGWTAQSGEIELERTGKWVRLSGRVNGSGASDTGILALPVGYRIRTNFAYGMAQEHFSSTGWAVRIVGSPPKVTFAGNPVPTADLYIDLDLTTDDPWPATAP